MKAWLSPAGTVSAAAVGAAVWAGTGWRGLAVLAVFFVTASALTRGGGRRRPGQVFANGGIAAGCALLARGHPALAAAFAGAIAAATADTLATEIGARSRSAPRDIVTGRPVEPGTSGGVTLLGSAGALLGAALIGATAWLVGLVPPPLAAWVAAGGVAGAAADSLLGATLQGRWRCPACDALIETPRHPPCGAAAVPARGWRVLDNDAVNAVATLTGAVTALLPVIRGSGPLP